MLLRQTLLFIYQYGNLSLSKGLFYGLLVVFYLMLSAPADTVSTYQVNDKVIHLVLFFGLMGLAHITHPQIQLLKLAFPLAVYGLATELSQGLLPDRDASIYDWIADLGGIVLAMGLIRLLKSLAKL